LNTKLFHFNSYANLFCRFSTNSATFRLKHTFFWTKIRFWFKSRNSASFARLRAESGKFCLNHVNNFYILLIICYLWNYKRRNPAILKFCYLCAGEMAERSNAAVLKTVVLYPRHRGFESLFLRRA
jgi:hypothetical protein